METNLRALETAFHAHEAAFSKLPKGRNGDARRLAADLHTRRWKRMLKVIACAPVLTADDMRVKIRFLQAEAQHGTGFGRDFARTALEGVNRLFGPAMLDAAE